MQRLNYSKVVFDRVAHTYRTPEGKSLSGVTGLLKRQLFAEKYKDIPRFVLERAKERGTAVHEAIEFYNSFGDTGSIKEVEDYAVLCSEYGLKALESEYLVSDNVNIASSIDIVFDDLSLADVKTTSSLDIDYLSWQLSIYAWLFEMQNPSLKANKLYAIWLPKEQYGHAKMVEVPRIPAQTCQELVEIDSIGGKYGSIVNVAKNTPVEIEQRVIDEIIRIEREMKTAKERSELLKKGLRDLMIKHNCKSYQNEHISLTLKNSSIRESVDMAKLKEKYPEVWEDVKKSSVVKESLILKVV